jgi:transketolase
MLYKDYIKYKKRLIQLYFEPGVGHTGGNLSSFDAMILLHHEYLLASKDHFILSKGHSAGALYVSL